MSFHSLLYNESLNLVSIRQIFGPNHSQISYGAIARPSFLTIDYISAINFLCSWFHAGSIAAVVWLCEAKTCNFIQRYEIWQPPLPLFFIAASIEDRNANTILQKEEKGERHVTSTNFVKNCSTFNNIELLYKRITLALIWRWCHLPDFRNPWPLVH